MQDVTSDGLPEGLVVDPSRPPRTVTFTGYLGESHIPGHVRLYADEELREWFDVPRDGLLHAYQYGEGAVRRTIIWVNQRTTLERRVPQPEDLEGEYIDGEVAAETVKQAAMIVALDYSIARRSPAKSPYYCS